MNAAAREGGESAEAIASRMPGGQLLVCHIILRLDVGGLENGLVNLVNHLPADRFRHAIICLQYAGDFRRRIHRPDVVVHELNKGEGKALHLYWRVWKLLRQMRPDIVHTRNLPTIDMLLPARLAGTKRLVHSEHGLDQMELAGSHRKYNWLRRGSRLLARHYISVSQDLGRWLELAIGIPGDRISVIHNGVDTARFRPGARDTARLPGGFLPPRPFVIGTIGRLEPVKDQPNLARAFVRLLARRPDLRERARLVMVGDGTLRGDVERILQEGGAGALSWLPGYRDDAAELYRCLDVFVLPSRREGISNTILEAMASGLPVVATRVGGNPEIVSEGVTGQLVAPEDPDELAKALLAYVDDPSLLSRHAIAARESVLRDFSLQAMVRNYQRVYLAL